MPPTSTPQGVIVKSGTFQITFRRVDTNWWYNPAANQYYLTTLFSAWPGTYSAWTYGLVIDGAPADIASPPPGFTPKSMTQGVGGDPVTGARGTYHIINTLSFDENGVVGTDVIADGTSYVTLAAATLSISIASYHDGPSFNPWEWEPSAASIAGRYDEIWFWWKNNTTGKDACGNPQDKQLQFAPTQPAGYALLDADSLGAQPTVVIDTVAPSHGPILVATNIEIRGSGFGMGATVKIGTTPATSVVVVNENYITCAVPALGSASTLNVVVTNLDGTHN